MGLESFGIAGFSTIDDFFCQSCLKLGRRGAAPTLADSEFESVCSAMDHPSCRLNSTSLAWFTRAAR
jgi:hypothetical protein